MASPNDVVPVRGRPQPITWKGVSGGPDGLMRESGHIWSERGMSADGMMKLCDVQIEWKNLQRRREI